MDTYAWGPRLWTLLNDCVFGIGERRKLVTDDIKNQRRIIEACLEKCPCPLCVPTSLQLIEDMRSGRMGSEPRTILWQAHNRINAKLGKPMVRYDKIVKRYRASAFKHCPLVATGFYLRLFDTVCVLVHYHDIDAVRPILSAVAALVENRDERVALNKAAAAVTPEELEEAFEPLLPGVKGILARVGRQNASSALNDVDLILTCDACAHASFAPNNSVDCYKE